MRRVFCRYLPLALVAVLCGCNSKPDSVGAAPPQKNTPPPKSSPAEPPTTQQAVVTSPSPVKFVRQRPEHGERVSLDACAYLGGFGFACLDALIAEKNPVIKRYMRRLSDADAKQAFDELEAKQPRGVPHAEFAYQCADSGPCGANTDHSDDGYMCLTRAESALQENNLVESKAAHERACKCGSERAQIPIMGGVLACNGKTPERRGQNLSSAEAKEIRDCAECEPEAGPAACVKEIERLSKTDPELAKYIETVHVPKCSRP